MKFLAFYQERLPNLPTPNDRGEVSVPCVFHADTTPSLSINLDSGKWRCFATSCPGHKGGGYKAFDSMLRGETVAVHVEPIPESVVDGFHAVLLKSQEPLRYLLDERRLTIDTVKRYKLGWDSDRIWIPVRDANHNVVNVRKYKRDVAQKMLPYAAGYNQPRLFPVEVLKADSILVVEGEWDALIGNQLGFSCVTGTAGASSWPATFTDALEGKHVVLCYDTDKAGLEGAQKVATKLFGRVKSLKVLVLPLAGTKTEKDLSDAVKKGLTSEELKALIAKVPYWEPPKTESAAPEELVTPLHLSLIGAQQWVGKRIKSTVLVAGKDLAPFQVPKRVRFQCSMGEKICARCELADSGGTKEVAFREWDPELLQMVNVHQLTVDTVLRRACGIPPMCSKGTYEVTEHANLEAIKAIPEIDFTAERSEYVIRQLFYLGHGLETNHTYDVEAVVMPDPKTQYATAVVYDAKSSKDNIEEFNLDVDTRNLLSLFKVSQ